MLTRDVDGISQIYLTKTIYMLEHVTNDSFNYMIKYRLHSFRRRQVM